MEPDRRTGMASIGGADIGPLVEAQQGPQPLANVFTGRSPCAHMQASIATAAAHRVTHFPPTQLIDRSLSINVSGFTPYRTVTSRTAIASRGARVLSEDSKPQALRQAASAGRREASFEMDPAFEMPPPPPRAASMPRTEDSLRSRKRNYSETLGQADSLKTAAAVGVAKQPPGLAGLKKDPDAGLDADEGTCCICMEKPDHDQIASIDGCDHHFCFECIDQWSERENTCPLCKNRFTKIQRVHQSKRQKGDPKNSKKVKKRDQRADLPTGNPLDGLLSNLGVGGNFPPQIARLIFSGLGGGGVVDLNSSGPGVRRQSTFLTSTNFGPTGFDLEDEPDTAPLDDEGYGSFRDSLRSLPMGSFPSMPGAIGSRANFVGRLQSRMSTHVPTPGQMSAPLPPRPLYQQTRSFAINGNDAEAGGSRENALEIDDDSDDDEVEVVDMSRRRV